MPILPKILNILINLPHPLEFIWLVWLIALPRQVAYIFRKDPDAHKISKTGELVSFKEITAVGCVGGFILLTFIFAYCTYLTLSMAGII